MLKLTRIKLGVLIIFILFMSGVRGVRYISNKNTETPNDEWYEKYCLAEGYGKCFDKEEQKNNYLICNEYKKECEYSCIDSLLPVEDCQKRCELKHNKCYESI